MDRLKNIIFSTQLIIYLLVSSTNIFADTESEHCGPLTEQGQRSNWKAILELKSKEHVGFLSMGTFVGAGGETYFSKYGQSWRVVLDRKIQTPDKAYGHILLYWSDNAGLVYRDGWVLQATNGYENWEWNSKLLHLVQTPDMVTGISFVNDKKIVVATNGIWIEEKKTSWQKVLSKQIHRIVKTDHNELFALSPDGLWHSSDGYNWIQSIVKQNEIVTSVIKGIKGYVAVTDNGHIYLSKDGHVWKQTFTNEKYPMLNDTAWDGENYVVVGDCGIILASKDTNSWNTVESGTKLDLTDVEWANGRFVAVGSRYISTRVDDTVGGVFTSTDAINWAFSRKPVNK